MKILITVILLLGTTFFLTAQFPTIGEVYDYQVGDEFHFEITPNEPQSYGIQRRYILERVDFDNSIEYTVKTETYSGVFPPNTPPIESYEVDTITQTLSNLTDTLSFEGCMDSLPPGACYSTDSLIVNDFCGLDVYYHKIQEGVPYFEYDQVTRKYVKGLGRVFYHYSSDSGGNYNIRNEMIYYKKGDIECGTPNYVIVGTSAISYNDDIRITPNPSVGLFQLEVGAKVIESIYVYDANGKLVVTVDKPSTTLDLSPFNAGLYFVLVRGENFYSNLKVIKM